MICWGIEGLKISAQEELTTRAGSRAKKISHAFLLPMDYLHWLCTDLIHVRCTIASVCTVLRYIHVAKTPNQ